MIEFPSSTRVGRRLPKEAFYTRLPLPAALKEKFVSDIDSIRFENSLTQETLRLKPSTKVKEIIILGIDLKKQEFDTKIIETIARQNKHQLIFLLRFNGQGQLAVYYRKLYRTEWHPIDELKLIVDGFNLDEIWDNFLEQIALWHDITVHSTADDIDSKLQKQDAILKSQKEIDKLEKLTRIEKQPKKKFELYQKLQDRKREMEELL